VHDLGHGVLQLFMLPPERVRIGELVLVQPVQGLLQRQLQFAVTIIVGHIRQLVDNVAVHLQIGLRFRLGNVNLTMHCTGLGPLSMLVSIIWIPPCMCIPRAPRSNGRPLGMHMHKKIHICKTRIESGPRPVQCIVRFTLLVDRSRDVARGVVPADTTVAKVWAATRLPADAKAPIVVRHGDPIKDKVYDFLADLSQNCYGL